MSRALLGIVALGALWLAAARSPAEKRRGVVQIGESTPAFVIETLNGGSMTADFHGRAGVHQRVRDLVLAVPQRVSRDSSSKHRSIATASPSS